MGQDITSRETKFGIGDVVRHKLFPFRGIIFDIDASYDNSDEWYRAIPEELRPSKDQPFYHLLAENEQSEYIAYVSEQNLLPDTSDEPVEHSQLSTMFDMSESGRLTMRPSRLN